MHFGKHLGLSSPLPSPSRGYFLLSYQQWKEKIVLFCLKAMQGKARSMLKPHTVSFRSFLSPAGCSLLCVRQMASSIFCDLTSCSLLTRSPHYNYLKRRRPHPVGAPALIQLPLRSYPVERLQRKFSKDRVAVKLGLHNGIAWTPSLRLCPPSPCGDGSQGLSAECEARISFSDRSAFQSFEGQSLWLGLFVQC